MTLGEQYTRYGEGNVLVGVAFKGGPYLLFRTGDNMKLVAKFTTPKESKYKKGDILDISLQLTSEFNIYTTNAWALYDVGVSIVPEGSIKAYIPKNYKVKY